jgi:hypothetical protein
MTDYSEFRVDTADYSDEPPDEANPIERWYDGEIDWSELSAEDQALVERVLGES